MKISRFHKSRKLKGTLYKVDDTSHHVPRISNVCISEEISED